MIRSALLVGLCIESLSSDAAVGYPNCSGVVPRAGQKLQPKGDAELYVGKQARTVV